MPKNTRVSRCVGKLTRKYGYGGAISICQKSTKQNYMTGKQIRKRRKRGGKTKRKTRKKRNTRKKQHKWSKKYKKSINCRRPKGFSQKQYCKYGRKHN
tara:strand:- start:163 stop:456 length:294 start_codon:yes stop_codon:yes gene_type:complete